MNALSALVSALACAAFTVSVHAAQDPACDLLPTFTGTASAALDLIDADVIFDSRTK